MGLRFPNKNRPLVSIRFLIRNKIKAIKKKRGGTNCPPLFDPIVYFFRGRAMNVWYLSPQGRDDCLDKLDRPRRVDSKTVLIEILEGEDKGSLVFYRNEGNEDPTVEEALLFLRLWYLRRKKKVPLVSASSICSLYMGNPG